MRWLADIVDVDIREYEFTLDALQRYIFNDAVGNDSNRTMDAINLRRCFEDEVGEKVYICDDEHCTLLEMMVALAERAADLMWDAYDDDQTVHYFWVMFTNLGLDEYTNSRYDDDKVETICENLLCRRYTKHGKGGLFQVKNVPGDMRKVEIWSQMNWYLTEKYFEKNGRKW